MVSSFSISRMNRDNSTFECQTSPSPPSEVDFLTPVKAPLPYMVIHMGSGVISLHAATLATIPAMRRPQRSCAINELGILWSIESVYFEKIMSDSRASIESLLAMRYLVAVASHANPCG